MNIIFFPQLATTRPSGDVTILEEDQSESSFIRAWKNFLCLTVKDFNYEYRTGQRNALKQHAYDALLAELDEQHETLTPMVVYLAELYLLLVTAWQE